MGKYEDCIKDCDKAVERGGELKAGYEMIARALTWKGTALVKMAKCSKYEAAIETFQKALTEHHNPDTLKKLNIAEKVKEDLEQQEYLGNEFFKQEKYAEAVEHYTESMRRDPACPAAYINRSISYLKLGKFSEGLKDAGMCVRLNPTFSMGYARKGDFHFLMKQYDKALETYHKGLEYAPDNRELFGCVQRCMQQWIYKVGLRDLTPDELKERQANFEKFQAMAIQDPETAKIVFDPIMRQVFLKNSRAAQEHLKDPTVANKIQKLIDAGLVKKTPGIFLELLLF